jgi:hypothetical protein
MDGFRPGLAVLVAINHYDNGVPTLRTPVSDAEELAELLPRYGFEAEIWPDQEATLDRLRALLADLAKRVSSDDRVIFYFARHGIAMESEDSPKGYVLPQDARVVEQANREAWIRPTVEARLPSRTLQRFRDQNSSEDRGL